MKKDEYEEMLFACSNDLTRLTLMDGSNWEVEPGVGSVICSWSPTDTIAVRYTEPRSVWPYELKHGQEIIMARKAKPGN